MVLIAAALSGCGPGDDRSRAAERFVAAMVPHHELGLALIDEATLRAGDVRLRRLVFEMGGYHRSEIFRLRTLATEWGLAPADRFPGDLHERDVGSLAALNGVEHDIWWLRLMIEHHEGAVEIAGLVGDGDEPVADLASRVIEVQRSEITAMSALLDELCGSAPDAQGCAGTTERSDQ